MFEYVWGKVTATAENSVTVEANGVGYLLQTSTKTAESVRESGEQSFRKVWCRHKLESEAGIFSLYGFVTLEERRAFDALISVKGVGRATALLILSTLEPEDLVAAVKNNDEAALREVRGVGPKAAARMCESDALKELLI